MSLPLPSQTCWVVLPRAAWESVAASIAAQVHPADFWLADGDEQLLTMAEVRALHQFAAHTPVGERKLAVIGGAHELRPDTANALLKLLEEPPAYLQVLLIGESDHLLPTLASRARRLEEGYFQASPYETATDFSRVEAWREALSALDLTDPRQRDHARNLLRYQRLLHRTINQPLVLDGLRSSPNHAAHP